MRETRLPSPKTLAEYDFKFPKRIPKAAILRLFDCDFIGKHECAALIGPTGTGSRIFSRRSVTRRLSMAIRFAIRVSWTFSIIFTAAQINGSLVNTLRSYVRPSLLLLDELGYLTIDERGAELLFQVAFGVTSPVERKALRPFASICA